ncbi:MAG: hypothetical protein F6K10_08080 [Moorea sp. SIO2B7]|nr:hypothetical protein [Moorena sp. SIO2B7]
MVARDTTSTACPTTSSPTINNASSVIHCSEQCLDNIPIKDKDIEINSLITEDKVRNKNMDINNYLPEEPEKRRVIMVLSRQDLNQLQINAQSDNSVRELLLNSQVSLLDDSVKDDSSLISRLRGSGLLNSGSILIQSPYDPSSYADALNASYSFAQAKCIHFANLCGLLAAKKVSVEQMEIQTSDGKTKFSGNLDTSYGGGGAEVESRAWAQMKKAITIEEEYEQGEPKLEQAKIYLSKYQWLSEPHMNGLLFKREA